MSVTRTLDAPFWEIRQDGNGIKRAYLVVEGLAVAPNGVEAYSTGAAGAFSNLPKPTNYNGIPTVQYGLPPIVAYERRVGQIAALTGLASYSVPAAADVTLLATFEIMVTVSGTHSFQTNLIFTDTGGTGRTIQLDSAGVNAQYDVQVGQAQGAVPYCGRLYSVRCKAGTTVSFTTTGTFTSVTYEMSGTFLQVA